MSEKFKLLQSYKKANKERRKKILSKSGYSTELEYVNHLQGNGASKEKAKTKTSKTSLADYVIAFDTTGSMASYIGAVKKHVKGLIPTLFKDTPDLRVSIVAFGDYCDMKDKNTFGNAYQVCDLTNDENKLIKFVTEAKDTGGGDTDEFYELVIKKITEETAWRNSSKRNVLFIGDCGPHPIGYSYSPNVVRNQIDWREEAKKAAKAGIQFDTLSIIGDSFYNQLAEITGGVCMPFSNASKTSQIVEASSAVRYSKEKFTTMYAMAVTDGDEELIGAYKSLSSLL